MIIPNWHPIFVHFTVALLFLSAVLFVVTQFIKGPLREQWAIVARWSLWFGVGLTLLTGLTGLYAYNTVAHDTPSHLAMTEHRNWAVTTIAVFMLLGGVSVMLVRAGKSLGGFFAVAMAAATVLLASTAWHGGEIVYRYGLGVMSMPKVEGHDHANSGHMDEHAHAPPETEMDFSGMDVDEAVKPHEHTGEEKPHSH